MKSAECAAGKTIPRNRALPILPAAPIAKASTRRARTGEGNSKPESLSEGRAHRYAPAWRGAAMRPFEYTLGLTSILVSLALANIVMCFHRLLRNAPRVTWDGRVLFAAALVIVEIV